MRRPGDWTDYYFVPNGIITYEDCPVCGTPNMRVEHGKTGRGSFQHFEHCTECGDSMPIVCYDCEFCKVALETDVKPSDWKPGDWWPCFSADTSEANVLRLAAKRLKVPEGRVEVLRTGGGWLAREKQEGASV